MKSKSIKANVVSPVPTRTLPPAPAKMTPWYPASVTPVRKGVYERKYSVSEIAYSRWDGGRWLAGSFEFGIAKRRAVPSAEPWLPWRGLASNPAKGQR